MEIAPVITGSVRYAHENALYRMRSARYIGVFFSLFAPKL
jgi:hypothetical protein